MVQKVTGYERNQRVLTIYQTGNHGVTFNTSVRTVCFAPAASKRYQLFNGRLLPLMENMDSERAQSS